MLPAGHPGLPSATDCSERAIAPPYPLGSAGENLSTVLLEPLAGAAGTIPLAPSDVAPRDLLEFSAGHGHPDYPCLSRAYSPSTCVPCRDFAPWLRDRVSAGSVEELGEYLWRVREANPGMGGSPEHFRAHYRELARAVLCAPLSLYLEASSPEAYLDLRVALLILAAHESFSGYIMTGESGDYLAAVMAPHAFRLVGVEELVERRNAFVADLSRQTSYWQSWPTLEVGELRSPVPPDDPSLVGLLALLGTLPHGTRAHAVDALRQLVTEPSVPRTLASLSRYETRKRGLEVAESVRRILAHGLLEPAADVESWLRGWTRRELLGFLGQVKVRARNSWSKEKLAEVALAECKGELATRMAASGTVQLAGRFGEGALRLRTYLEEVRETWRVWLAFGTAITI